jgi:type 1 glutamine amidotransferase
MLGQNRRVRVAALLLLAAVAQAQTKRVLYLTATYGYRHSDAIDASAEVFRQIAAETGTLEIVHTEDLSWITAARLRDFDAVYFFTSGELPLSDSQKADLLAFVRDGKGFGGSHSATDTLYTWPEYGALIGGVFDGHPWVREAAVDVEDPENPLVAHLAPSFRAEEEFYQFRAFSRDNVRVLLTLDTRGLDPAADDVPLVWVRNYGRGRVFYSAFGHFPLSYESPPLRAMLRQALLWLTGQIEAPAEPRVVTPRVTGLRRLGRTGSISIAGEHLTSGSSLAAAPGPPPIRLAGTRVEIDGVFAPLVRVSPGEIVAQLPATLDAPATLTVWSGTAASDSVPLRIVTREWRRR